VSAPLAVARQIWEVNQPARPWGSTLEEREVQPLLHAAFLRLRGARADAAFPIQGVVGFTAGLDAGLLVGGSPLQPAPPAILLAKVDALPLPEGSLVAVTFLENVLEPA
jgi:hypothetical protein